MPQDEARLKRLEDRLESLEHFIGFSHSDACRVCGREIAMRDDLYMADGLVMCETCYFGSKSDD